MKEFPVGFKIIKEMTKNELIEEIIENQRVQCQEMELKQLRHVVADFRIKEATKRIHAEAGFITKPGILGGLYAEEEDDDE